MELSSLIVFTQNDGYVNAITIIKLVNTLIVLRVNPLRVKSDRMTVKSNKKNLLGIIKDTHVLQSTIQIKTSKAIQKRIKCHPIEIEISIYYCMFSSFVLFLKVKLKVLLPIYSLIPQFF